MTEFLYYIARSGLYLGIFYAFYLLVMRHATFFRMNRIVLLLGSVICSLLPLLKIRTANHATAAGPLSIIGSEESSLSAAHDSFLSWPVILSIAYLIGALVIILYTTISTVKMIRLIKTGEKRLIKGYLTTVLEGDHPSFSFGKIIVIGRKDLEENPAIFTHEMMHVKCCHYLDLFIYRIIQIVWWWNPLVWIMRTELGLLHEYEADDAVIDAGIEARQYQMLLVRKAVGDEHFVLASGFQHSNLKSRISMMLKGTSPKWFCWCYVAILPILSITAYAVNPVRDSSTEGIAIELEESVPFHLVDVKPTFNGGDANEFSRWVNGQLQYPENAKKAGIQGRIDLSFAVDVDGYMKDIRIVRGVHPDLDTEALRVLTSCSERWTPGSQDGHPVKVTYNFPIYFQLK